MVYITFIIAVLVSNVGAQDTRKEYFEAEDNIMSLERAVLAIDTRLSSTEEENVVLREQLSALKERLVITEDSNAALQEKVTSLGDAAAAIAFTALAPSGNHEYAAGDIVIFSHTITNIGGHYVSSTGIFTCPVDGTYMFAANFLSSYGENMIVRIVKDDSILVGGYADDIEGAYNTGSVMIITACGVHEQVWVRSGGIGKMRGDRYSTFSGFLLYQGV